jgi:formylglycine-generating enzyme required for sulfatase activity
VASSKCGGQPVRVDALPLGKSASGALNLTGNVWEWVHDWYDPAYYQTTAGAQNPMGPVNAQDPTNLEWRYRHRVVRGGSFSGVPADLRTTYRFRLLPDMYASDLGFRCAKSSVAPVALQPATR